MASVATTCTETSVLESARTSTARFYHPELDELRFFAFLMVFLHHAFPHDPAFWTKLGLPLFLARFVAGIGSTGAFGVSLFFVLSSYLITELLLREKDLMGTLDLRSFYIRRILRIWPLYFAFLALAVALQWIVPGQHVTLRAGLWFSFLAGNWFIVFHGFPSSVIFPLWSVSIEEQFYITWPAIVRKVNETGMMIFAGLLLVAATSARIYLGMQHTLEGDVWCNTFVQLDPIAAGILMAVLLKGEIPRLSRLSRAAMTLAGITALALGSLYFGIKNDPLTTARIVLGYPSVAVGGVLLLLSVLRTRTSGGQSSAHLSGPHFLWALCVSRPGPADFRSHSPRSDSKPFAICTASWSCASGDDRHGCSVVSLAGNAISEPEAALHTRTITAWRMKASS